MRTTQIPTQNHLISCLPDGSVVVRLEGTLTLGSPTLRDLSRFCTCFPVLNLDLSDIGTVDPVGIGALKRAIGDANKHGTQLIISGLSQSGLLLTWTVILAAASIPQDMAYRA